MGQVCVDDGTVGGGGVTTGVGHPDAPPDRPIGLQVFRFNPDTEDFEAVVVYMNRAQAAQVIQQLVGSLAEVTS